MKLFCAAISILLIIGCNEQQEVEPLENQGKQDSTLARNANSFNRSAESVGQLVYVPVYSHIYQQDRQKTFNLTTTLSIRNADPFRSFMLTEVSYYDSKGQFIQHYLDSTVTIEPLASTSFVIEERDLRGGVGANFIVNWKSNQAIIPPVIEAVNITTSQQQGISFLSVGRVLQEHSKDEIRSN